MVTGFGEPVVQSAGSVSVKVASTFVGPKLPLLCATAEPVTLKAVPAFAEPGLDTVTLLTLTSEDARMFVFEVLEPLLLAILPSVTCSWSTATVAVAEKLCADGLVQVTDHVIGDAGTVVATEVASEVFWIVTGFVDPVVQSPGSVRAILVSTFVGPKLPLL
jgi:hypothetical protein